MIPNIKRSLDNQVISPRLKANGYRKPNRVLFHVRWLCRLFAGVVSGRYFLAVITLDNGDLDRLWRENIGLFPVAGCVYDLTSFGPK